MSAVISARGITYRAGGQKLVDGVDFAIQEGSFTTIIGPNGAGKSTLLRLLCGEVAPHEGEVLLNGRTIGSIPAWEIAHCRAVMPQASELNLPFTAFEVTRLGIEGIGRGLSREKRNRFAHEALDQADVACLADRNYQTLSGGERQRVHFARVLAQLKAGRTMETRQVLFLDEPTASLDLRHQLALLEEARRLTAEGLTIVAVLHDLQLAAHTADDLALMYEGRLLTLGQPDEVLTPERLDEFFGVRLATQRLPPPPWTLPCQRPNRQNN
jgi:iron complex transport system ATP-binding protein